MFSAKEIERRLRKSNYCEKPERMREDAVSHVTVRRSAEFDDVDSYCVRGAVSQRLRLANKRRETAIYRGAAAGPVADAMSVQIALY